MNTDTVNAMKEIADKINAINSLKSEIEDLLRSVDNADLEDCLNEYVDSVDSAECYVFDTLRAYEDECKFKSLEWIY